MSIHVPLPVPACLDATQPAALSELEQTSYDCVLEHFSVADYTIPGVKQEKAALTVDEEIWLSYECLLRYLRGTKWDANEAIARLEGTLKWRREFGIYDKITSEYIEPEGTSGKVFVFGYDSLRRPAIYMCPSKQNTEESPRQIEYTVWLLERAIDLMGPGVESLLLMIDYADKAKSPSISQSRKVPHILQTHYPERLGLSLINNLPWFLHTFYKLITPFIDPITRLKMVFNPVINQHGLFRTIADAQEWDSESTSRIFEPEQLVQESWNGSQRFIYSHEVYWEALVKLCEERRAAMAAEWHRIGGRVGTKEWDVKVSIMNEMIETQVDVDVETAPAEDDQPPT